MSGGLFALECVAYGVCFRLTAESEALVEKMKTCVPWSGVVCRATSRETSTPTEFALVRGGEKYRLTCDGVAMEDRGELEEVLEQLARVVMIHVADHAPDRIFVHAGVVAWQGRALLLPGVSFAGKSSLVAALVRAGATYFSDEYAVLDASGRAHPYARELQMREPGSVEQRPLMMPDFERDTGGCGLTVSHVVFTEFVDGGKWNPEAMSPGNAVLAMMEHSIAVQRAPARVMSALARMMETAWAVRSERGDAVPTAAILLEIMSAEATR
jgi:hypothetical protein